MTVQINFWDLILLLLAFFGFVGAIFKMYDARQDRRFDAQDEAREKGGKLLREMISEISHQQRAYSERLARLESDVEHVPTHDDIKALNGRIDDIQKEVGRLPGIERLLHGINEYLRESGK